MSSTVLGSANQSQTSFHQDDSISTHLHYILPWAPPGTPRLMRHHSHRKRIHSPVEQQQQKQCLHTSRCIYWRLLCIGSALAAGGGGPREQDRPDLQLTEPTFCFLHFLPLDTITSYNDYSYSHNKQALFLKSVWIRPREQNKKQKQTMAKESRIGDSQGGKGRE